MDAADGQGRWVGFIVLLIGVTVVGAVAIANFDAEPYVQAGANDSSRSEQDFNRGRSGFLTPAPCSAADSTEMWTGLQNGADVGTQMYSGHGILEIRNGTGSQAVVQLVDSHTSRQMRAAFVEASSTTHLAEIPEGRFRVRFVLGWTWLRSQNRFCHVNGYSEFLNDMVFTDRQVGRAIYYDSISITLHPVIGGSERIHALDSLKFVIQ